MEPVTCDCDALRALVTSDVRGVIDALGGANNVRLVGGCVRDALLGRVVTDIDLATIHAPDEVMSLLSRRGIKTVPTGIKHGTVTACLDRRLLEITTLRVDTNCDGRHSDVDFTRDWLEDARRRDFTINTLLADAEGRVFDPLGVGLSDLRHGRVRFVGEAEARIQEDVLRILRFFRFYGQCGQGAPDEASLAACSRFSDLVPSLSRERITQEFFKILSLRLRTPVTLRLMFESGVLRSCFGLDNWSELEQFCQRQEAWQAPDPLARLYALRMTEAARDQFFALSNVQKKGWRSFAQADVGDLSTPQYLKEALYHYGRDAVLQMYLLRSPVVLADDIALIRSWDVPVFPVTGADLLSEGFETGAALGAELKRREAAWIKAGFVLREDG